MARRSPTLGGWVAVGGTAAWLVPLVGLALLAWHRPDWAAAALGVLLLGLLVVYGWSVITPESWTTFEDTNGPIGALIAFALAAPMAVLGCKRARVAGVMLIALPVLPTLLVLISVARGLGAEGWPIAVVTAPAAIVGVLHLVASFLQPPRPPRSAAPATHGSAATADRRPASETATPGWLELIPVRKVECRVGSSIPEPPRR